MVAYFDAASDRIEHRARHEFEALVEAVRVGTIFAHDAKAARAWQQRRDQPQPSRTPMSDAQVEAQIMALAGMFPGQVIRGTMA